MKGGDGDGPTSGARATFARSRAALRRVPAWAIVLGFFAFVVVLALGLKLVVADDGVARLTAGLTSVVVLVAVLVARGQDGWGIYGTVFLVGLGSGELPLSVGWRATIQGVVSVGLAYLFYDRGWLSDADEGEVGDAAPAERAN